MHTSTTSIQRAVQSFGESVLLAALRQQGVVVQRTLPLPVLREMLTLVRSKKGENHE
ncbi:hypothetical protein [Desulfovibrio cuneatus]|uniref:hypothetical protein n=1 Tax=Desulfovibrio cuneatus TaxID=159728 RepID=UPI000401C7EB|nr:hypothetical protein [Desulfovibrio cuneatus]